MEPSPRDRTRACLLGGAVGDALGAAVEFMSLAQIQERFGPGGIGAYAPAYGRTGAITDDTQMTMFTAEGLLRARAAGAEDPVPFVHRAYLRWLHTQGMRSADPGFEDALDGWLVRIPALHEARAPGSTCLSGLAGAGPGAPDRPLNDSKGCGGVMRIAPVGLLHEGAVARGVGDRCCALTHGHPSGWIAGGLCASLVDRLVCGEPPRAAVVAIRAELDDAYDGRGDEVRASLDAAMAAADVDEPTAQTVESLGEGWVAEEALAIAVFCLLAAESFEHGVGLAVNHSGDSDSTGAIAGNLLGAARGLAAIPDAWLEALELRDALTTLADDLFAARQGETPSAERYPPR